jgi:hypothetical protein
MCTTLASLEPEREQLFQASSTKRLATAVVKKRGGNGIPSCPW